MNTNSAELERVVIFLTGQDPTTGKGGGSSYVRSHCRASLMAGFETHIFCLARKDEIITSDFGTVHRVATPVRPRWPFFVQPEESPERFFAHFIGSMVFTPHTAPLHAGVLSRSIEQFMLTKSKSYLVHSFYCWGGVGLKVRERMKTHGIDVPVINSCYTTLTHEVNGKLAWTKKSGSYKHRFVYGFESLWSSLVSRNWERKAIIGSQIAAVNYESVRQLILQEYGQNLNIRKLPYSPESAFLRTAHRIQHGPPDPATCSNSVAVPLIISVSRHDPRKGLETLIRSLGRLRDKGVAFQAKLASGGTLLQHHQQLVEALNLSGMVILPGWIEEPFDLMEQADIFVLPSLEEGSGSLSLLEAMQAGLAIVASDIDGIPEDVTNNVDGLLVEPGNINELSVTLEKLLTNTKLMRKFQTRAREKFQKNYSTEYFCSQLSDSYAELWQKSSDRMAAGI